MGADGGVCWCDTTNLKRALELLYPVSAYLEEDDGPNDVAALANNEEICKHSGLSVNINNEIPCGFGSPKQRQGQSDGYRDCVSRKRTSTYRERILQ